MTNERMADLVEMPMTTLGHLIAQRLAERGVKGIGRPLNYKGALNAVKEYLDAQPKPTVPH